MLAECRRGIRRKRGKTSYRPSTYAGTIGTAASMARMAAPFLKVPMLPVRDSVPSGKITTDQPWPRCSLRRSSAGRAPPARGMGKVLISSSVSIASHLCLKMESAAATTNARKRNRLGSACNMTTASRALLWLETKMAPPLIALTRYRSITVSGEKEPINGKMMKVCRSARAPRTVRARGQDGSLTGGWLVVSTFLPSGGRPAKVRYGCRCRNIASLSDGSTTSSDRKRLGGDQSQPGPRTRPRHRGRRARQRPLDGAGRQEHRRWRGRRCHAAGAWQDPDGRCGRHRGGRERRGAHALHRRKNR